MTNNIVLCIICTIYDMDFLGYFLYIIDVYKRQNQYYVCCAQELTPGNIDDIYNLFSDYMKDSNNVIDLNNIDNFLKDQANNQTFRL